MAKEATLQKPDDLIGDLGTYEATAGLTRASMKITGICTLRQDEVVWREYAAHVHFSRPVYSNFEEHWDREASPDVAVCISGQSWGEVVAKLRSNEANIETLLRAGYVGGDKRSSRNYLVDREVMRCVFKLEDQTNHIFEKEKAYEAWTNSE